MIIVIVGLGGMGGVQLLVVKLVGGVSIIIEIDFICIWKCFEICYLDEVVDNL